MRFLSVLVSVSLAAGPAISQVAPPPKSEPDPLKKEREELDRLTVENRIEEAKDATSDRDKKRTVEIYKLDTQIDMVAFEKEMRPLAREKEKLALENALRLERLNKELAAMELEIKRLETKSKLDAAQFQVEMVELRRKRDKAVLENQLKVEMDKNKFEELREAAEKAKLELEVKIGKLREEKELLKAENDKKTEQLRRAHLEHQAERDAIDLELKRISLEGTKMKFEADQKQTELQRMQAKLNLREKAHEWKDEANKDPLVVSKPFQNGRLTISDRRIALNGPIYGGVADYVTSRIHYYNNISADPIFLVIDRCPGGSVMEGYRIVKAIEASKAPIHVVVKSFAASMAAVIAALADYSYAYPNAVILHHEMSTVTWGNMTQLKEQLEIAKKWEQRLHNPVAKKIGLSPENFRKQMYANNSDGDWQEFGDDAQKMKWVAEVVGEIRETGIIKNPDAEKKDAKKGLLGLAEQVDENGKPYMKLPRLAPYDMYYIHNPDNYYR